MARKKKAEDVEDLELEEDFDVEEGEEEKATKKAGKGKKASEPKGIGAREIADHLGVDPKTFRAWLRRQDKEELGLDHDHKSRYAFGKSLNSPVAKKVIKAWKDASHERGRPKKEEGDDEDE